MLPKFSLKQLLIGIVFCAIISGIFSIAGRGNLIAYGLSVAILGLIIPFSIYGVCYWLAKLFSMLRSSDSVEIKAVSPAYGPDELSK